MIKRICDECCKEMIPREKGTFTSTKSRTETGYHGIVGGIGFWETDITSVPEMVKVEIKVVGHVSGATPDICADCLVYLVSSLRDQVICPIPHADAACPECGAFGGQHRARCPTMVMEG